MMGKEEQKEDGEERRGSRDEAGGEGGFTVADIRLGGVK